MSRPTPFEIVFGELAAERFPALKASLAAAAIDPFDRDAFLLDRAVTEFLRDLVPEDAPTESLHEFIAVLQHSYLFWNNGRKVVTAGTTIPSGPPPAVAPEHLAAYVALPSHLYWGQVDMDEPHEPLDGFFVHGWKNGIRALAIFGLHPERPGLSAAEVAGPAPVLAATRADGSAPFAPKMDGGAAAGLRSVADAQELLALAWHSVTPES